MTAKGPYAISWSRYLDKQINEYLTLPYLKGLDDYIRTLYFVQTSIKIKI